MSALDLGDLRTVLNDNEARDNAQCHPLLHLFRHVRLGVLPETDTVIGILIREEKRGIVGNHGIAGTAPVKVTVDNCDRSTLTLLDDLIIVLL